MKLKHKRQLSSICYLSFKKVSLTKVVYTFQKGQIDLFSPLTYYFSTGLINYYKQRMNLVRKKKNMFINKQEDY